MKVTALFEKTDHERIKESLGLGLEEGDTLVETPAGIVRRTSEFIVTLRSHDDRLALQLEFVRPLPIATCAQGFIMMCKSFGVRPIPEDINGVPAGRLIIEE